MNTTAKGDEFEERVYNFLKQELEQGNLGFDPRFARIFSKHKYYSDRRKNDIVFDVSIELWLPDSESYWMVVLIECKNLGRKIEPGEIAEFENKAREVADGNAKRMIFTTSALTDSAFNVAESHKMSVVRWVENQKFKWELRRHSSYIFEKEDIRETLSIQQILTSDDHSPEYGNHYAYSEGLYTRSLKNVFQNLLIEDVVRSGVKIVKTIGDQKSQFNDIPFLSPEQIQSVAKNILESIGYKENAVDLISICELQHKQNGLTFNSSHPPKTDNKGREILGSITFNPLSITLYQNRNHSLERMRFTLAHELGHYFLDHGKLIVSEYCTTDEPEQPINKVLNRMEIQANMFAAELLMPEDVFILEYRRVMIVHSLHRKRKGMLYVDNQPVNQENLRIVCDYLAKYFQASRRAVKVRLDTLKQIEYGLNTNYRSSTVGFLNSLKEMLTERLR